MALSLRELLALGVVVFVDLLDLSFLLESLLNNDYPPVVARTSLQLDSSHDYCWLLSNQCREKDTIFES